MKQSTELLTKQEKDLMTLMLHFKLSEKTTGTLIAHLLNKKEAQLEMIHWFLEKLDNYGTVTEREVTNKIGELL